MPYLPNKNIHGTAFPTAYGKDLETAVRQIESRWKMSYPKIAWKVLKKATTEPTSGNIQNLSGEVGSTLYDPLYGESIATDSSTWAQTHNSDAGDATEPDVYGESFLIHAQIRREVKEKELKKYGFDQIRDILVTIPVSFLDLVGIKPQPGDRFVWDGDTYQVTQREATGYWKNTNLRLYEVINAEHARFGA
jgi:hypothetical protein